MGYVNVICAEKTGTLNENEMTITVVVASDGEEAQVRADSRFVRIVYTVQVTGVG
jgi:magnesium-transporting ATPase (P-type)